MINKIVIISTPHSIGIANEKVDNVLIIKMPSDAKSVTLNVECDDFAFENGVVSQLKGSGENDD